MPSPQVSVLIPAYFSDDTLAECLLSLRHQSFRDFEVILVNSSPDDGARRVAQQFPEVVFEQAPRRLLPHAARNRGAERARGEILVFTDPDCRADPAWLARLIEAHRAGHHLVCGSIELQDKPGDWFARGVHLCKYSFRLSGLRAGHTWVAGTANASCTRLVWESIGPFDGDRFAGDALYSWRAAAKTWQPWFEPRAITEHRYTGTFRSFCRERYSRGQDFADARVTFERWPFARLGMYLMAVPVLVLVAVTRGAIEAFRAGWGRQFVWTFPLQVAGHAAWSLGEAVTHLRLMLAIRQSSHRHA
jgi:glycosyltransferase involved in cell wall biosynthesis